MRGAQCHVKLLIKTSKLVTTIVSTFTANYVLGWAKCFPDAPLTAPLPSFDGRAVCYPSNTNLRDYLSWRQADCKYATTGCWASVCAYIRSALHPTSGLLQLQYVSYIAQATSIISTTLRSGLSSSKAASRTESQRKNYRALSPLIRTRSCSSDSGSTTITSRTSSKRAACSTEM